MADIFSVNYGYDIAITLTEDGAMSIIGDEQRAFTETLVLADLTMEERDWTWYIEGEANDGYNYWQWQRMDFSDTLLGCSPENYKEAAEEAIQILKTHENADQWQRGIKSLERLLADPSLDPRFSTSSVDNAVS